MDNWNNNVEFTMSNFRMLDPVEQKELFFKALRSCDFRSIRTILQANRDILNEKMFGYEGSDVYEVIKNNKSKRCYSYTGNEKDGYFYPLHVATEAGHKNLTILMIKAGADATVTDYKGMTPEDKCNGNVIHAFYELKGLRYESQERYQGSLNRQGQRHGQGTLFYKPEGYLAEEHQLYRGNFKDNLYEGHGSLYHPGTKVLAYIGRFKNGEKHGRGVSFSTNEMKVYKGYYRENKRDGWGEEYNEQGKKIYYGDWVDDLRHGFGCAIFSEGSKYFGRWEKGTMSGVGIYIHSNLDRFEGIFYQNKPDGMGSFYEKKVTKKIVRRQKGSGDKSALSSASLDDNEDEFDSPNEEEEFEEEEVEVVDWVSHHCIWQAGRKVKDAPAPFAPLTADLPDSNGKELFADMLHRKTALLDNSDENAIETMDIDALLRGKPSNTENFQADKPAKKLTFTYFEDDDKMNLLPPQEQWKAQIGIYLRLPLSDCTILGIPLPPEVEEELKQKKDELEAYDEENNEEEEDNEDDVDDVTAYHFMDYSPLFVAYVYVNSASKIFESRLNHGVASQFPDFEPVYHLVIDAVDTYNDKWESTYKHLHLSTESDDGPKMGLLSAKEKKEELMARQRVELALKKGTAELDPKIEKALGDDITKGLQKELLKLLVQEDRIQYAGHSSAASVVSSPQPQTHSSLAATPPGKSNNTVVSDEDNSTIISGQTFFYTNTPNSILLSNTSPNPLSPSPSSTSLTSTSPFNANPPASSNNSISLDELFAIENAEAANLANIIGISAAPSNNFKDEEDKILVSNEFALELIQLLKTTLSLT